MAGHRRQGIREASGRLPVPVNPVRHRRPFRLQLKVHGSGPHRQMTMVARIVCRPQRGDNFVRQQDGGRRGEGRMHVRHDRPGNVQWAGDGGQALA